MSEVKNPSSSYSDPNSIKEDFFDIYRKECTLSFIWRNTRNILLIIIFNTAITVIAIINALYYDESTKPELQRLCDFQTLSGRVVESSSVLISVDCNGPLDYSRRSMRIILYYSSYLISLALMFFTKNVQLDIKLFEDKILYLIYSIRSLSFYNVLEYSVIRLESNKFVITSVKFYDESTYWIVFGSISTSILITYIFKQSNLSFVYNMNIDKSYKEEIIDVIVTFLGVLALIANTSVYLTLINTQDLSITQFIDTRGYSLNKYSFITYSIIISTILEYYLISALKKNISDQYIINMNVN